MSGYVGIDDGLIFFFSLRSTRAAVVLVLYSGVGAFSRVFGSRKTMPGRRRRVVVQHGVLSPHFV